MDLYSVHGLQQATRCSKIEVVSDIYRTRAREQIWASFLALFGAVCDEIFHWSICPGEREAFDYFSRARFAIDSKIQGRLSDSPVGGY